MPSVLPGLIDNWRGKRNGKRRYVGKVLLFDGKNKKPIVIAEVYGDTLEEMRRRKHLACKALEGEAQS